MPRWSQIRCKSPAPRFLGDFDICNLWNGKTFPRAAILSPRVSHNWLTCVFITHLTVMAMDNQHKIPTPVRRTTLHSGRRHFLESHQCQLDQHHCSCLSLAALQKSDRGNPPFPNLHSNPQPPKRWTSLSLRVENRTSVLHVSMSFMGLRGWGGVG